MPSPISSTNTLIGKQWRTAEMRGFISYPYQIQPHFCPFICLLRVAFSLLLAFLCVCATFWNMSKTNGFLLLSFSAHVGFIFLARYKRKLISRNAEAITKLRQIVNNILSSQERRLSIFCVCRLRGYVTERSYCFFFGYIHICGSVAHLISVIYVDASRIASIAKSFFFCCCSLFSWEFTPPFLWKKKK